MKLRGEREPPQEKKTFLMADKKHLRILKKGVKAWNRWREKNLEVKPDLSKTKEKTRFEGH